MEPSIEVRIREAMGLYRGGRFDEAELLFREILEETPEQADATLMIGVIAAQTDQEAIAVDYLSEAVRLDGANLRALTWLSGVLSFLGRNEEAETFARRAVDVRPDDYDARLKLASALFGQSKFSEAAEAFTQAIRCNRDKMDGYFGLATTLLKVGEPFLAREVLRDAAKVQLSTETLLKLGEVCLACEDPQEAVRCAEGILARSPKDVGALTLLARAHRNAQDEHLEDSALQRLREVSPDNQLGHTLFGRRLQSLGQFPEAEAEFRRSIELRPNQGIAYYGITAGRRMSDADNSLIVDMEGFVANGDMNQDERAHLHFALGKAYDNLGDYGAAMSHFDSGNQLMRELRMGTRKFDREAASKQVDQIIDLFTPEFIEGPTAKIGAKADYFPTPIFIAGIMRSGTTLAEQILSCHPEVGGGGEQSFWRPAEAECVNYKKGLVHRDTIRVKAKEYVALLAGVAPSFAYVTDKNPANRLVYGLLHIAYPNSRIIHMKRNPVDVAISIYTTLIRTGAPFVGDRDDIVFALKEHERLSEHWKSVLPADRLLEVEYEKLVQDRETETRRLVDFCGLPWNEACLHPESNLRTVVTPSFWQVRQPVYTGSLNRWKRYEPWLGVFANLLP